MRANYTHTTRKSALMLKLKSVTPPFLASTLMRKETVERKPYVTITQQKHAFSKAIQPDDTRFY